MQAHRVLAKLAPGAFMEEAPEHPAAVLDCFVRLVEAGEIEPAIGLLSKEIVTLVGFEKLESMFSERSSDIWSAGGIESVDVQTLAFSGDQAELRLSIWYGDHKIESEVLRLVREDRLWRISMEEVGIASEN